ncbi:MAG: hypothetical protein ICV55_01980 [Coleofasciculus sp. C3-bin4]|nr:hypothetical protein [Coleofasciculus sp. C3-bin4]
MKYTIETKTFDIREYVDRLTPTKEKNRYECPVCGGNNLTIQPETGKYRCWNECQCKDIRDAIAPWQEASKNNRVIFTSRKPKPKATAPKPVEIPEGELKIAMLPQPVEIPQRRKMGDRFQIIYPYSDSQWVARTELSNGKKEICPWRIDAESEEKCSKGDFLWPPYRIAEVQAHGSSQWVLAVEGEKCVESARWLGLVAFTLQGGWSEEELERAAIAIKEAGVAGICCYPDHDDTGYKKAEKLALASVKAQVPFVLLDPTLIWKECPNKGDIADWIESGMQQGWEKEEFVRKLEVQFNAAAERERLRQDIENDDWEDDAAEEKKKKKAKIPGQDKIGAELAEQNRPSLAWHSGLKVWFRYSEDKGVWEETSDESIKRLIATCLYLLPDSPDFSANYVDGISKLLKAQLEVTDWDEQRGLIPLQDGVLEVSTLKLLPHAPGYRFLWQLPYRWSDHTLGCQLIHQWLTEVTHGDEQVIQFLRAYLKAIVTGRTDLQKYLELVGPGGSGKGTYSRLAQSLIGEHNTGVTTLKQLEENRFETAGLFGKRLLLITDSEKYGGDVSTLKAITGGDSIRYEKKNVQQTKPYTPTYMVVVAANEAIQSTDYTSGLARRRITIPFNLQVANSDRRDLDAEFKPYLAGCLEWVLSLPDNEMERLVRNTGESVFAAKNWKTEALLDTNPLADWFDTACCIAIGQKTYVGGLSDRADLKLYPSYTNFVQNAGCKPVAMRRFSKLLVDLVSSQLGYKSVRKLPKNEFGVAIADIILRDDNCAGYPRPITGNRDNPPNPPNPPSGGGGDNYPKSLMSPNPPFVERLPVNSEILPVKLMDETLGTDGFDGTDGFFESASNNLISEQNSDRVLALAASNVVKAEVKSDLSSEPSNPSAVRVSSGSFTGSQQGFYRQPVEHVVEEVVEGVVEEVVEEVLAFSFDEKVEAIAGVLANEAMCPDRSELAVIRKCYAPAVLNAACKLLSPERHAQIKQWVLELNDERKAISLGSGEGVGHQVRIRSLKGELSTEIFEIVSWDEQQNGFYTLSNGDTAYPCNLRLVEE